MASPEPGVAPPPTGLREELASGAIQGNIEPADCRTLWREILQRLQLPEDPSPPQSSVELMGKIQTLSPCNHPEQINEDLGNFAEEVWEDNRSAIRGLVLSQENPNLQTTAQSTKLFKISDVPKFSNTREYDTFRTKLIRFLRTVQPPSPLDYARALEIILTSFEDESITRATLGWDVTQLIRPTWTLTYDAFLHALDLKFQAKDFLEKAEATWMKTYPKNDETPADFFNRFDGVTNQYVEAAKRSNIPVPNEPIIVGRLVQVLPRYLKDHIRIQLRATTGENIQNLTMERIRDLAEYSWTYLPKPAATGHNTDKRYNTASTKSSPAITGPANNVKERQCGIIASYDTSPAVPTEARGSLMPDSDPVKSAANNARRHYCAQRNLCLYCRRPRSEHQASAPRFKAVTIQANSRPAPAALPPIPNQLQIEAPPAPSSS